MAATRRRTMPVISGKHALKPTAADLAKTYPARGPLQLFRFVAGTAFRCFQCGETKKSKLIAVYSGNWERRLCNGCYGRLLSIYEIKQGKDDIEVRADALAEMLQTAVSVDDARRAELLLRNADRRADLLSPSSVRFVASSQFVAAQLTEAPALEWSPAVIGLCKAVETELVTQLFRPLAEAARSSDLSTDQADKDIGRIAAFCAEPTRKPPELGSISHFLQTVSHSESRRATSPLIKAFLRLMSEWTDATWVLNPSGLHRSLSRLSSEFRNPAAHTDELNGRDYEACRDLVIGGQGILWRLHLAAQPHR